MAGLAERTGWPTKCVAAERTVAKGVLSKVNTSKDMAAKGGAAKDRAAGWWHGFHGLDD